MHLAQVNIGRMKAPLDDPSMHGFVSRLAELNALADGSDGFVWRMQDGEGAGNTYLRPFDDDRIIVNMSVWESVEQLRAYTYNGAARRDAAAAPRLVREVRACGARAVVDPGRAYPDRWTRRSSGWRRSTSTAPRRSRSRSRVHFRQHQLSSDLCRCHLREPGCASIGKWADFRHGELLATSVSIG